MQVLCEPGGAAREPEGGWEEVRQREALRKDVSVHSSGTWQRKGTVWITGVLS